MPRVYVFKCRKQKNEEENEDIIEDALSLMDTLTVKQDFADFRSLVINRSERDFRNTHEATKIQGCKS